MDYRQYILERDAQNLQGQAKKETEELIKKDPLIKRAWRKIKDAASRIPAEEIIGSVIALAFIVLLTKTIRRAEIEGSRLNRERIKREDAERKKAEREEREREKLWRAQYKHQKSRMQRDREAWDAYDKSRRKKEQEAKAREKAEKEYKKQQQQQGGGQRDSGRSDSGSSYQDKYKRAPSAAEIAEAMKTVEREFYHLLGELIKDLNLNPKVVHKAAKIYWNNEKGRIETQLRQSKNIRDLEKVIREQRDYLLSILKQKYGKASANESFFLI